MSRMAGPRAESFAIPESALSKGANSEPHDRDGTLRKFNRSSVPRSIFPHRMFTPMHKPWRGSMDTYAMTVGHASPGVVTGKPVSIGGSEGRADRHGARLPLRDC